MTELGDKILVGAEVSATAYVFDRNDGSLLFTIPNPDPTPQSLFGVSATIFHDQFLVSGIASGFPGSKGGAYLFDQSGKLIRSFPSPTNTTSDAFGIKVATVGDIVAVSAIVDSSQAPNSGVVYLFNGDNGQFLRTILNPYPKDQDRFGVSLSPLGANLVIGSTGGTAGAGAAYVFNPTNGNLVREFDNPTPAIGDDFGRGLATIGNDVLIGAPGDDTNGADVGSVYRFNSATGDLVATIADPAPSGKDNFGWSIGVAGSSVAIGAPLRSLDPKAFTSNEEGAVYLFDSNLRYSGLITGSHDNQERFGMVTVGAGSDLLLGDQTGDGFNTQDAGRAYVYSVPEPASMSSIVWLSLFCAFIHRRPTSYNPV